MTAWTTVGHAVPVSTAAPGSDEWLADREHGIGGSDIAVLLGVSDYKSPTRLWLEKTGQVQPDGVGEAAEWGHRLQHVVLDRWAEDHDDVHLWTPETGEVPSIVAHPDVPAARVSLDAAAAAATDVAGGMVQPVAVVEAKTAGSRQAPLWADGGIPRAYLAQALYQLAVTGLELCYVPVLIGGQRYESRLIEADRRFTDWVLEFVAQWWDVHVVGGRQPDPDPVADAAIMDLLVPPVPDSTVVLDAVVVENYRAARVFADEAAAALDIADRLLRDAIGPATHALDDDGRLVATLTASKPRASVTVERVRELAPPELAEQLITTGPPPRRTLRWKGNE